MDVSFHLLTPDRGNETVLLRFEGPGLDAPACVLVDAGQGATLDDALAAEDELAAVLLTHAHRDHYESIATVHRPDVPVYAGPATAAMGGDVLDVAETEYAVDAVASLRDAVTPMHGWTELAPGIAAHPVPAGHAPGAVGFLVRFADDAVDRDHQYLLCTGDFTERDAAGFPGFRADLEVDVGAAFLTAATDESFESELTTALGTILEQQRSGGRTLVTASGLVSVQLASILVALSDRFELGLTLRIVGHAAKLYAAMEYDADAVEAIPEFDDPTIALSEGAITIAGPEVPTDGRTSDRLFSEIRDDPSAALVQVTGGGVSPRSDGSCFTDGFDLRNHPSAETLRESVRDLEPKQLVLVHTTDGHTGRYNDWLDDGFVWGIDDRDRHELYAEGHWRSPDWMPAAPDLSGNRGLLTIDGFDPDTATLPSVERHDEVRPAAEGVDLDELADRLYLGRDAPTPAANGTAAAADGMGTETETEDGTEDETKTASGEPAKSTPNGGRDDSDQTDADESSPPAIDGPIRTVGPASPPEPEESLLEPHTPRDVHQVLASRTLSEREASERADTEPPSDEGSIDVEAASDPAENSAEDGATEGEPAEGGLTEGEPAEGGSTESESTENKQTESQPTENEPTETAAETAGVGEPEPVDQESVTSASSDTEAVDRDGPTAESTATETAPETVESEGNEKAGEGEKAGEDEGTAVALDPVTVALLERRTPEDRTRGRAARSALVAYLAARVGDGETAEIEANRSVTVDLDAVTAALVADAAAEAGHGTDAFLERAVLSACDVDPEGTETVVIPEFEAYAELVEAVVADPTSDPSSAGGVVDAAVAFAIDRSVSGFGTVGSLDAEHE